MGSGSWNPSAYTSYKSTVQNKSASQVFTQTDKCKSELNPLTFKIREARDSIINPNSTAIIVALDETGSMGDIAVQIAKNGLGVLFQGILDRKPITYPHLMFMGIGDVHSDQYPLQASQFEADNCIIEQLTGLYLEGNGGGNGSESYHLPWYFAATRTSIDCWEKRQKKGWLFTIGDEGIPPPLTKTQIKQFLGDDIEVDSLSAKQLLEMAQRNYNVYHILIEEGSGFSNNVKNAWKDLLNEHAILLSDYTKLSEVIISILQVANGIDKATVTQSWSDSTALVVDRAINGLQTVDSNPSNTITRF